FLRLFVAGFFGAANFRHVQTLGLLFGCLAGALFRFRQRLRAHGSTLGLLTLTTRFFLVGLATGFLFSLASGFFSRNALGFQALLLLTLALFRFQHFTLDVGALLAHFYRH